MVDYVAVAVAADPLKDLPAVLKARRSGFEATYAADCMRLQIPVPPPFESGHALSRALLRLHEAVETLSRPNGHAGQRYVACLPLLRDESRRTP